jgi:hypothetical protein
MKPTFFAVDEGTYTTYLKYLNEGYRFSAQQLASCPEVGTYL